MNKQLIRKVVAGVIALSCGIIAGALTYYFLGFITEPLIDWLKYKLLGGAIPCTFS
jgi:hypothetical protein